MTSARSRREQEAFLAAPHTSSAHWLRGLLERDPSFVDDVLALSPMPTRLRATVYDALRHLAPSFWSPAPTHRTWADRVVAARWLTPRRFDGLIWLVRDRDGTAVSVLTQHRHFRPRHVLATLIRAEGQLATDGLRTMYRTRGPEFSALVDVFDALRGLVPAGTEIDRAGPRARSHPDDIAHLTTKYGLPVEAMSLDTVRTLAVILESRVERSFPKAVQLAHAATLTTAPLPGEKSLRLPRPGPG